MGNIEKTTYILIGIYAFLYPLLSFVGANPYAVTQTENMIDNFVDHNTGSHEGSTVQGQLPTQIISDTAVVGTETLNIVSGLRMAWDFLKWFGTSLIGGMFALMLLLDFPLMVAFIIGLPFTVLQLTGLMSAFRGWDL